jgi:hypothetical protein
MSIVALGFVTRDSRVVRIKPMLAAVHGGDVREQLGRTIDDVIPSLWPHLEPMNRIAMDTHSPVVNR